MWPLKGSFLGLEALPEEVLVSLRGGPNVGAVEELDRKHFLAFNLRGVADVHTFVPRAYYIPADCENSDDVICNEGPSFRADFALSQAVSILVRAAGGSESAKACSPSAVATSVACRVCRKFLESPKDSLMVEADWHHLTYHEPHGVDDLLPLDLVLEAQCLLQRLQEQALWLQVDLLFNNIWILKPVAGAHGQGIAFVTGLDVSGDPIMTHKTSKVSFKKRAVGDEHGFVIQKYIEKPHLLSMNILGESVSLAEAAQLHKYNLRFFVDVLWSDTQPEAWFYESGYVQFANSPYSDDMDEMMAHVSNWAHLPTCKAGSGKSRTPRECSTETYRLHLLSQQGRDIFSEILLPQMQRITAKALSSVRPGTSGTSQRPWKRLGLDFLITESFSVFLIEINKRPGMGNAPGARGDSTHELISNFFKAEKALRNWRGNGQNTNTSCDGQSGSEHEMLGFRWLEVPAWVQGH